MRIIDKDPPSREAQDAVDRLAAIILEDENGLINAMADDHTPAARCFLAAALREIGFAAGATFIFGRR